MNLSVEIAGLKLTSPLIAASGTFGYGTEYLDVADYSAIGAFIVKGLYLDPRDGCAPPRIWETPSGMLNAIGLQGVGVHRFVEEKLPNWRARPRSLDQYLWEHHRRVCRARTYFGPGRGCCGSRDQYFLSECPKGGILFGCDPTLAAQVTEVVRKGTRLPVIPKLSPNVTDIAVIAVAWRWPGRTPYP